MNQIFEFRRELNIKKIVAVVVIIIIVLSIIGFFVYKHSSKIKEEKIENQNPNSIFYDESKTISIEFTKTYGFVQYKSQNDYLIELRTENNLNLFVSKKDKLNRKEFS